MQAIRSITATNYSVLTCCMRHHKLRHSAVFGVGKWKRFMTTEPLTVPAAEGLPKVYPEKIQDIVSQICQLSLLEVADLNELLKKTLNISDAPVMAFGAGMAAPAAAQDEADEEEAAPVKVQTSFTVKMNKYDETKKVSVIKEVKARLEGYNLVQAKKFVESCPCVLKAEIPKDEAEQLLAAFQAVGAECIIE